MDTGMPQGVPVFFYNAIVQDFALRNLEQWRYNEKGIVETLSGMISRCEILNNGVIIGVSRRNEGKT